MPKSLKISLILLILASGFVVFRILLLFSKNLDIATARDNLSQVKYDESNDYDHDGLSNNDEAYWNTDPFAPDTDGDGFLDGEEVLSGHDPLSADANDLLSKNSELAGNLTDKMAGLIVSGVGAGDLKNSADPKIYSQAVGRISSDAVYGVLDDLINITLQDENFTAAEPSLKNQQEYIDTASNILDNEVLEIVSKQPQEITEFFIVAPSILDNPNQTKIKNTYLDHAIRLQEEYQKLHDMPVPKNLFSLHKDILLLLKKIEMNYRSIALANDDPLKMLVVITNLQTVYPDIGLLINKLKDRAAQVQTETIMLNNNSSDANNATSKP